MKRTAFLLILSGAVLAGGSERDTLVAHLEGSAAKFQEAIRGLTEAQLNFKAGPDRWSIAECAEHIAASEDFIFGMAQKSLESPASPERKAERLATDALIVKVIPDRSRKFQAPEPLRPSNRYTNARGAARHFRESRARSIDFVRTTTADLRAHASPHPAFKEADTYQWLLFMSAHSERHTAQILEVKADANFPK